MTSALRRLLLGEAVLGDVVGAPTDLEAVSGERCSRSLSSMRRSVLGDSFNESESLRSRPARSMRWRGVAE